MVLCSLASPHQGALSRRVSSGPCPRLVQLLRGHKGCVLCKTEGQAVPSSPPPAPLLILSLLFCLSFPFLSIFGPGQPGAAFVLVLSGSPDLLPWFLFPFPEDGGLFFFCWCAQGVGEHCVLRANPWHVPEVLCSVARGLLIFSRLVRFVQIRFSGAGLASLFGGSLLLHSKTI